MCPILSYQWKKNIFVVEQLLWKAAHDNRALPVIAQKFLGQPMFDHFWKKKKRILQPSLLLGSRAYPDHRVWLTWGHLSEPEKAINHSINQAECNRVLTSQSQSSKKWDRGTWLDFRWSVSPAELEAIVEGARWSLSTANEFDHLDGGQDDQATVSVCKMI